MHPNHSGFSRCASGQFIPGTGDCPTPRQRPSRRSTPGHNCSRPRSGLRRAMTRLRCHLLTAAGRSGRSAPPSARIPDTPQISRGQSYCLRLGAGLITHAPQWMEDIAIPCQFVPGVPRLRSRACTSPVHAFPATFRPHLAVTPLRFPDPAAPRTPGQETFTPKHDSMHGTHAKAHRRCQASGAAPGSADSRVYLALRRCNQRSNEAALSVDFLPSSNPSTPISSSSSGQCRP
jgi:hypothetical protein